MSFHSYSNNSAFFDLPKDYDALPSGLRSHRLLTTLPLLTAILQKLNSPSHRPASLLPPPSLSTIKSCLQNLGMLIPWRKAMFEALTIFYKDTFEYSRIRNLGASHKVKMMRSLYAIRCYATLVKQIREARKALKEIRIHAGKVGMDGVWRAAWTNILTVEVNMEQFVMYGSKPVEEYILLGLGDDAMRVI